MANCRGSLFSDSRANGVEFSRSRKVRACARPNDTRGIPAAMGQEQLSPAGEGRRAPLLLSCHLPLHLWPLRQQGLELRMGFLHIFMLDVAVAADAHG